MSKWRPIKTAPKDGKPILAAVASQQRVFTCYWADDRYGTDTGEPGWINGSTNKYEEYYTYKPTHWQPLPEPPRTRSKK